DPDFRHFAGAISHQFRPEGAGMTRSRPLFSTSVHIMLAIAAAISLVPFLWLICASVKTGQDLFRYTFLPADLKRLTFDNYSLLFQKQFFGRWIVNSIFLA